MFTLIVGGAASGKSEVAEALAAACPGPRTYIATLLPWDEECRRRIQKHRLRRAGQGWATLEMPTGLSRLSAGQLPAGGTVLLECMSNLAANELYCPEGAGEQAFEEIAAGLNALLPLCGELIVVSNEVFCGGADYEGDTLRYLRLLARVNRLLAARADVALEVVAGVAIPRKGALPPALGPGPAR